MQEPDAEVVAVAHVSVAEHLQDTIREIVRELHGWAGSDQLPDWQQHVLPLIETLHQLGKALQPWLPWD